MFSSQSTWLLCLTIYRRFTLRRRLVNRLHTPKIVTPGFESFLFFDPEFCLAIPPDLPALRLNATTVGLLEVAHSQ